MKKVYLKKYKEKTNYLTPVHPVGDLIAFGEDVYNKYKNTESLIGKFQTYEGKGFIVYNIIEGDIVIDEVYANGINSESEDNIIDSLLMYVRNQGVSLKKKTVLNNVDEKVKKCILKANANMKSQQIDVKFRWQVEE